MGLGRALTLFFTFPIVDDNNKNNIRIRGIGDLT